MPEKSIGINTSNADEYVAAFEASEQADGHTRAIQIIATTAGKVDETIGSADRTVSSNDSLDVTAVSGNIIVGDNAYFACYLAHSESNGSCLVTPLLCDNDGNVIGTLEPKQSDVNQGIPLVSSSAYLSRCLVWEVMTTGAHKLYPHVYNLSDSNSIDMWCFTY